MKTFNVKEGKRIVPLHFTKRAHEKVNPSLKSHFLFVRSSNNVFCLEKRSITYLKASGNYTEIHTSDGKAILSSKTLKHYAEALKEFYFMRTHQSYLVNLYNIERLDLKSQASITLKCGMHIPVSRSNRSQLTEILQN